MPEESGEITAEQLLAAAEQHDAVTDVGKTPVVEIETAEPEPEETPEEPKLRRRKPNRRLMSRMPISLIVH